MLAALDGQYFTGEDVGLTLADADFLRSLTPNVAGTTIGGSENPSPVTAEGVFLGLEAAHRHVNGDMKLAGRRVAVQGLGAVGRALCDRLAVEGAELIVTDIDDSACAAPFPNLARRPSKPDEIVAADADIFAPCALGAVLSAETIPALKARIVAGSANNQLARHEDARLLKDRGVLYAPDYVINAGGLINVAAELAPGGYDRAAALAKVEEIPATLLDIFARAEAEDLPTNDVAQRIAEERIAAARNA